MVFIIAYTLYTEGMQFDKRVPFLLLSFVGIAVWNSVPALATYSLQLVAAATLVFFALRFKHSKDNLVGLIAKPGSSELIPLTIVVLLLITSTGNTHSWFYPLTYLYLCIAVFSVPSRTALLVTAGTVLLQLFFVPVFTVQELIILLNIPLMTGVLLFAKNQYAKNLLEEKILLEEERELSESLYETATLETYIQNFLLPKTESLSSLEKPETDLEKTLHSQITLIVTESKKILERARQIPK